MTLLVALKWILDGKESVVVSSDSKVTVGPVSYETRKVYPILLPVGEEYIPLAIAGGAGDASIIKQSYRVCKRILKDLAVREWGKKTLLSNSSRKQSSRSNRSSSAGLGGYVSRGWMSALPWFW